MVHPLTPPPLTPLPTTKKKELFKKTFLFVKAKKIKWIFFVFIDLKKFILPSFSRINASNLLSVHS